MKKRNLKKIKIAATVLSIAGGAVAAYKVYSRKKIKKSFDNDDINDSVSVVTPVSLDSGYPLRPGVPAKDPVTPLGCDLKLTYDENVPKKVLITGAGSYIGESVKAYASQNYPSISLDTLDMLDPNWRDYDFSGYDCVYHVAGIAHADVGKVTDEQKEKYYAVNTDLAIEVASKAKSAGVSQFIFMSSMIVYGDSAPFGKEKMIDRYTAPEPSNFYGDSKWQADKGVRALADEHFKVAVLRPPMIYGKDSKGNYPLLAKIAKKTPAFPDIENKRSMLYIENLCEFVCKLIMCGEGGIYFPQNREYAKTSELVRKIGKVSGKIVKKLKLLNPVVKIASAIPGKSRQLANKAFGNSCYKQDISQYSFEYRVYDLSSSIKKTEGNFSTNKSKKILFLVNHDVVIYNFRLEIVERFIADGHEVHISSPYGERIDDLVALGAKFHEITMDRHGMNPKDELKIYLAYKKLIRELKPDIVLGFTIKPNIYGAMAARKFGIPFVANITGLGTAVENRGWKQRLFVYLYRYAFRGIQRVFFQNEENRKFFVDNKIAVEAHDLLPGSGVNLERFSYVEYPEDEIIKFAFISRIMKEKGIDQYLEAAKVIKKKYDNVEFHVCGFCEEEYDGKLQEMNDEGIVIYHGMIRDVAEFMGKMHCIVHPTFYPEGLSNVLLEACATGRPIITTDRSGCREVVDDGYNGYMIPQKDSKGLIEAIEKFIFLKNFERKQMGLNARKKVENVFDREIVVKKYNDEIKFI